MLFLFLKSNWHVPVRHKRSNKHMRAVAIYRDGIFAGTLTEVSRRHYVFRYEDDYFHDPGKPAISLTLPKTQQEYSSEFLFPVFSNMLSEGANRQLQSRHWRIDEADNFGIMMVTAQYDTAGAITAKPITRK